MPTKLRKSLLVECEWTMNQVFVWHQNSKSGVMMWRVSKFNLIFEKRGFDTNTVIFAPIFFLEKMPPSAVEVFDILISLYLCCHLTILKEFQKEMPWSFISTSCQMIKIILQQQLVHRAKLWDSIWKKINPLHLPDSSLYKIFHSCHHGVSQCFLL